MTEEIKSKVTSQGYRENPDLMPVPTPRRLYDSKTFMLMMFSMNTCIPMFFLGPIGRSLGLDIWQVLVGAFIGNLSAVIVMWLNSVVGVKYGISYPVQLREPFGFKGIHVPIILRGISGTMWFGVEVYAGSLALMMIGSDGHGRSHGRDHVDGDTVASDSRCDLRHVFYPRDEA